VNLDAWEGLSDEARAIPQEEAIRQERGSAERRGAMRHDQLAAPGEGGTQESELRGEAPDAHLEAARDPRRSDAPPHGEAM
jgi:hypothetical protein